jgi:hypothetical protein
MFDNILRYHQILFNKYKKYIKISFFLIFILFLIKIIDFNQLLKIIKEVKIGYIFLALLLFFNSIFLVCLRSFILIKKFTNLKFFDFLNINVYGLTANSITFTSFAADIFKYYIIKKEISAYNSFTLVLFDKLITFYFKIIYFIFLFNIANIFLLNFYIEHILVLSLIIVFLSIYILHNFEKVFKFILNNKIIEKKKYLFICSNFNYVAEKIFLFLAINFLVLINITFVYVCIFKSLKLDDFLLPIILINPILETLSQLSIILPGIREMITIFALKLMNIEVQTGILTAFVYSFLTYVSLLISNLFVILFSKNKK